MTAEGAHRVSWMLAHGPIPQGMFILHRCDNPPCVNPAHLFLGTAMMNVADMEAKGRGHRARGEAAGKAKLTEDQVRYLRSPAAADIPNPVLAREFGVSTPVIWRTKARRIWKHVR